MPVSYVPPAMRTKKPSPLLSSAPSPSTKKTALKKEFAIDTQAFPSLGETIKKTVTSGTPISFSSAAAKKIMTPKEIKADVLPGWVHIRKHEGKIQYKYGEPIKHYVDDLAEQVVNRIILKNRIAREQYDRNVDIERLGDLSEFYGQPPLAELYENALEAGAYSDDSSESESIDYSYEL
jgi:hypothetical protein